MNLERGLAKTGKLYPKDMEQSPNSQRQILFPSMFHLGSCLFFRCSQDLEVHSHQFQVFSKVAAFILGLGLMQWDSYLADALYTVSLWGIMH